MVPDSHLRNPRVGGMGQWQVWAEEWRRVAILGSAVTPIVCQSKWCLSVSCALNVYHERKSWPGALLTLAQEDLPEGKWDSNWESLCGLDYQKIWSYRRSSDWGNRMCCPFRMTNLLKFAWNSPCFSTKSPESQESLSSRPLRIVSHSACHRSCNQKALHQGTSKIHQLAHENKSQVEISSRFRICEASLWLCQY